MDRGQVASRWARRWIAEMQAHLSRSLWLAVRTCNGGAQLPGTDLERIHKQDRWRRDYEASFGAELMGGLPADLHRAMGVAFSVGALRECVRSMTSDGFVPCELALQE